MVDTEHPLAPDPQMPGLRSAQCQRAVVIEDAASMEYIPRTYKQEMLDVARRMKSDAAEIRSQRMRDPEMTDEEGMNLRMAEEAAAKQVAKWEAALIAFP